MEDVIFATFWESAKVLSQFHKVAETGTTTTKGTLWGPTFYRDQLVCSEKYILKFDTSVQETSKQHNIQQAPSPCHPKSSPHAKAGVGRHGSGIDYYRVIIMGPRPEKSSGNSEDLTIVWPQAHSTDVPWRSLCLPRRWSGAGVGVGMLRGKGTT